MLIFAARSISTRSASHRNLPLQHLKKPRQHVGSGGAAGGSGSSSQSSSISFSTSSATAAVIGRRTAAILTKASLCSSKTRLGAGAAAAGVVVLTSCVATAVVLHDGTTKCSQAKDGTTDSTARAEEKDTSGLWAALSGFFGQSSSSEEQDTKEKEVETTCEGGPGKRVKVQLEPELVESLPVMGLDEVRQCNGLDGNDDRLLVTYDGKSTTSCFVRLCIPSECFSFNLHITIFALEWI